MGNFKDLTGEKFNALTIVEYYGKKDGRIAWRCLCDCGNEFIATGHDLKNNSVKSCGCYRSLHNNKFIDLTGMKFNKLKVIRKIGSNKHNKIVWECQCECGNYINIPTNDLKNGHTKSCGCILAHKYDKYDITNVRFGKLIALKKTDDKLNLWECKCDCGNTAFVNIKKLLNGNNKSCGCLHTEQLIARRTKHKMGDTRIYKIWSNMKQRCSNPKIAAAKNYMFRNIKVCKEWEDFLVFYKWAISNGYNDHLTIERINVNGNYEPSNCTWITLDKQALNKTDSHLITYNGVTQNVCLWAKEYGIKYHTLLSRINVYKWGIDKALNEKVKNG